MPRLLVPVILSKIVHVMVRPAGSTQNPTLLCEQQGCLSFSRRPTHQGENVYLYTFGRMYLFRPQSSVINQHKQVSWDFPRGDKLYNLVSDIPLLAKDGSMVRGSRLDGSRFPQKNVFRSLGPVFIQFQLNRDRNFVYARLAGQRKWVEYSSEGENWHFQIWKNTLVSSVWTIWKVTGGSPPNVTNHCRRYITMCMKGCEHEGLMAPLKSIGSCCWEGQKSSLRIMPSVGNLFLDN